MFLDLGCGTGYLFLRFLRRGFNVTGLDISSEMIEITNNSIAQNEKTPRASFSRRC
ncbi:MAG: hypothetical protein CM1200mP16_16130 [Nitrospina sp.]|nr:MAG: hypothetical protein CM1200mP16_16130 [Nitrospina sp.]